MFHRRFAGASRATQANHPIYESCDGPRHHDFSGVVSKFSMRTFSEQFPEPSPNFLRTIPRTSETSFRKSLREAHLGPARLAASVSRSSQGHGAAEKNSLKPLPQSSAIPKKARPPPKKARALTIPCTSLCHPCGWSPCNCRPASAFPLCTAWHQILAGFRV